jgi:hypothetical protein
VFIFETWRWQIKKKFLLHWFWIKTWLLIIQLSVCI